MKTFKSIGVTDTTRRRASSFLIPTIAFMKLFCKWWKEEKTMVKKVRYNGGTQSYYGCSDPTNLVPGEEYEVVHIEVFGWHTKYSLRGVDGKFDSTWFD